MAHQLEQVPLQVQDLLAQVQGIRQQGYQQGQVPEWVFPLEKALERALEHFQQDQEK